MDKHTPGPWKFISYGSYIVVTPGEVNDRICVVARSLPKTNQIQNARLMAAAPELLMLLQELVNYLDEQEHLELMFPIGKLDFLREQARAAIERATGGGDVPAD